MSDHNNSASPCCEHLLGQLKASLSKRPSSTAEIDRLDGLIKQIKQFTEQRATILQQINNSESRDVALPAEILSIIFEYACIYSALSLPFPENENNTVSNSTKLPKEERRYVPLVLGAVCARWRQVAWSTPTLWTSIFLKIFPGVSIIRLTASILQLYMQNSGTFPVSLELDFQEFPVASSAPNSTAIVPPRTSLEPIQEVISQQYGWKIKALRLNSPPVGWLPQHSSGFSSLEDFSIGWTEPHICRDSDIQLQGITALRRFSIRCMENNYHPKIQLYGPNITVLHLYRTPFRECVGLLVGCPNLVSYQCFSPLRSPSVKLREPMILTKLETFAWPCHDDDSLGWIIGMLRFPSLKKLHLHGVFYDFRFALKFFFPSLSSTLRILELDVVDHTYENQVFFKEAFQTLVGMTDLTLSSSCTCTLSCLCTVLTPSADGGTVRLPNLRTLRWRDIRRWPSPADHRIRCEPDGKAVVRMLEMRNSKSEDWGTSLHLEVSGQCDLKWEKCAQ